jgi:hypothetical protein
MLSCTPSVAQVASQRQPVIPDDLINDVVEARAATHPATPFLEKSTLLLAEIDLNRLEVAAAADRLGEMFGQQPGPAAAQIFATGDGLVESLKAAGVQKVYVTAATRSVLDGGPLLILPCENPAAVEALLTPLVRGAEQNPALHVQAGNEVVLVGPPAAVARVASQQGDLRPDLVLPLVEGQLDHRVVISLPEEARRELVALWPDRLPENSPVQLSPRALAADIQSVVVSLRLPPEALMQVHFAATDGGAADRVARLLGELVAFGDVPPESIERVGDAGIRFQLPVDDLAKAVMAVTSPLRKRVSQARLMNSLKQVGLAIHLYHEQHKHLPPRCLVDAQGTPLLSIHVALLPHLEQAALHGAIQLDQAWNSEANRQFTSMLVPNYCGDGRLGAKTTIRFPVYPGSVWDGAGPPKDFREVTDGTSNTIAAIDAPDKAAIEWANPDPWVLSAEDPRSDVFGDRDAATVLMLDGSVLVLQKAETSNEQLRAMLTIAGGES